MLKKLPHIGHDYETYSEVDLKEVGPWAYSIHPSTEVISWALTLEEEEPQLWLPGQKYLKPVYEAEKYVWCAWNNFFEYCIWHNTLKLPALPIENQLCTQALALALALPRSLGECGQVLGLPQELVKNSRGEELIRVLCSPDKKTGERNRDPVLLEEFYEYNKQDTIAERAVKKLTRPLIPQEREIWEIDFRMNIRGVPVDVDLLKGASKVYIDFKAPLKEKLKKETGLDNPNSQPQFKNWLHEKGYPVENLQKATIEELIASCEDKQLIKLVEWRSALARTPLTKYGKILEKKGNDGRFHGALSYHVPTTGRWSSTGVNFQNLNHPTLDQPDIEICIELLKRGDVDLIEWLYDDPIEAMSSCLRGIMRAEPGKRLIVADYKAIEARVIAWLAGEEDKLNVFRTHGKIYEHAAVGLFGVASIDTVEYDQRQSGKVVELACGFQGGYRAVLRMARSRGIDIKSIAKKLGHKSATAFAKFLVAQWRSNNRKIVKLWKDTERAAIRAVLDPGKVYKVNQYFAFKCIKGMLLCQLPSGRQLAYFNPKIETGPYDEPQLTYWCVDSKKHKWMKRHSYGGDLVQGVTQGAARDVMAHAMPKLVKKGYDLVMLIHDEIISEMKFGIGSLKEKIKIMCELAPWMKGLPVAADGFESVVYRKE